MSVLATVTPMVTASPSPEVIKTVVINQYSHLFQLAEIIKYIALGAGLSLIHAVVNGKFGLPKWLNVALPLAYAAVGGLAITVVSNTVNWADWYQVFLQVLAGAAGLYALITVVNAVNPPAPTLPTTTTP